MISQKPRDVTSLLAKRWGMHIRAHRELRGWSRDDLAAHLGVSMQAVAMWESGHRIPSDYLKPALIAVLALDPWELMKPVAA